jgi:serine/threonine-protein kinase
MASDDAKAAAATRDGRVGSARPANRPSVRPGGPASLVGVVLSGRYRIERLLGEGGMGAVYQAEHTHMKKRLAVKVLHPEMSRLSEVVARFEREAMAAAHIDHPNVATATDFGKLDDGSFFLVLEFVEGTSLRDAINDGRLPYPRAMHVVRQIAGALQRAHSLGIVHRDLKPENVMLVEREGDPDFVKVLDFGIAKVPVGELGGDAKPGQALTQLGMVYGTPEYMAPEQALGQNVDARADLYALGVMAFEMLAGMRPFDHESKVALLGMHVTAPVPKIAQKAPDAEVPEEVEAIVRRLLAKEASDRFADARELIDAINVVCPPVAVGLERMPSRVDMSRRSLGDVSGPHAALPLPLSVPSVGGVQNGSGPGATVPALPLGAQSGGSLAGMSLRKKRMVLAFGALAALLLVTGVLAFAFAGRTGKSAGPTLADAPTTPASIPTEPPPKEATDAGGPVEANEPGQASGNPYDELLEFGETPTAPPTGQPAAEVVAARALLQKNDAVGAVTKLLPYLKAQPSDTDAKRLFVKAGDALYEQAYAGGSAKARATLNQSDVRARVSPAAQVAIDLRNAGTCEAKRAVLTRARDYGDARALPLLRPLTATKGCGFANGRDCYPCLRRDNSLANAIRAISDRTKR